MVMFPLVALIMSLLFEGLELSKPIIAGMALVLAGNVFILRGRKTAANIVISQADNEPRLRLSAQRLR